MNNFIPGTGFLLIQLYAELEDGRTLEDIAEEFDIDLELLTRAVVDDVKQLRSIVDKLPKTADGVYALPGMILYRRDGAWGAVPGIIGNGSLKMSHGDDWSDVGNCYSTREAAKAAKEMTN